MSSPGLVLGMYEKLRALASRKRVGSSGLKAHSLLLRGRIESDNAIPYAPPKVRPVPVCPRHPRGMAY